MEETEKKVEKYYLMESRKKIGGKVKREVYKGSKMQAHRKVEVNMKTNITYLFPSLLFLYYL